MLTPGCWQQASSSAEASFADLTAAPITLRLKYQPNQAKGGDRAEQHLFSGLLLPVVQSWSVMAVIWAGQRQPDVEIR